MRPSIPRSEFAALTRRTGVRLTAGQRKEAYEAYGYLEAMLARVHAPFLDAVTLGEATPAAVFDAEEATR